VPRARKALTRSQTNLNCLSCLAVRGQGKSWFAKRTARRAAQVALNQLDNSTDIADIEVPIYATCQHFLTEGGSPRRAVFAAAERSLPDLGSTGFADAVAALIDNHPKTLLVLDSLDEAPTVDSDRLQSAADIAGWRLLLTSRPSAWNHQIKVKKADPRHAIAELQQLSYPEDVKPCHRRMAQPVLTRGGRATQESLEPPTRPCPSRSDAADLRSLLHRRDRRRPATSAARSVPPSNRQAAPRPLEKS
jgi:hypothetical protein